MTPAAFRAKVSHHGSSTATTLAYCQAIHPAVAVIFVGAHNTNPHPAARTLANLNDASWGGVTWIYATARGTSSPAPPPNMTYCGDDAEDNIVITYNRNTNLYTVRTKTRNDTYTAGGGAGGPIEDSDGDGLTDGEETNTYFTDPHKADTDGDGFSDFVEVMGGSDPLDGTPPATVRFNFQPGDSARVNGYVPATAGGYVAARGFGWRQE